MMQQRISNAVISHKNKNPLTNDPVDSHIAPPTVKKHNIPTITKASQPNDLKINLESLSAVAVGLTENMEVINKRIDQEFS